MMGGEMSIDLNAITLGKGKHDQRGNDVCLLEAVAWYAGEDHSDMPKCVSPVLRIFGVQLNDVLPDDKRQELKPLIPNLVGTAGDGLDEVRSYLALDWLIRTYTATWLDLAGLTAEAQSLRDLRRIVDLAAAQSAGPVVRSAANKAAAAGAAAWAAAWDAAWAAAGPAAWDAARDAARAAAWDAARAAAGAAARAAAGAAARAAAGAAARDVLSPTVQALQTSAIDLYRAMARPEVA